MRTRAAREPAPEAEVEAETEAEAEAEDDGPVTKLSFNQPLLGKPGRPIAVVELLKRLETLGKELQSYEQEKIDPKALSSVASELAAPSLFGHKDKGVKAWQARCLVDILRLCAPDAPFTGQQLKEIFTLFISHIIAALGDPENPYNKEHLYILASLSKVKSIILLADVPSSNNLIARLFEISFDILSKPETDLNRNVEYNIGGVLQCMVDECQSLPPEVVDMILAQFLRADPISTGAKRTNAPTTVDKSQPKLQLGRLTPAYTVAQNLCNTGMDRMSRYISNHFANVIMGATSTGKPNPARRNSKRRRNTDDSDEEEPRDEGPSAEDLKDLEKAHRLLRELWRAAPGVIHNVVPQIEAELAAESVQLRSLATEAVGDMAAGIGAGGPPPPPELDPAAYPPILIDDFADMSNTQPVVRSTSSRSLAQTHRMTYQAFLGRRNDKSPQIRSIWTSCVGRILSSSAGGIGMNQEEERALAEQLSQMLVDSDEKVRVAAVQAVTMFDLKGFVTKLGSLGGVNDNGSFVRNLIERVRDKGRTVRSEAILVLGKLWGVASGDIAAGNEQVSSLLSPIPTKILESMYVNDREVDLLIDRVMFESLCPLGYPSIKKGTVINGDSKGEYNEESLVQYADKIRTQRLLLISRDLEKKAKAAFVSICSRATALSQYVAALLKDFEAYNGGVADKNQAETRQHLGQLIAYFSKMFPDAHRVMEDLWKFATIHDRRSYALIRFCVAPDSDYKKVHRSIKEIMKRMDSNNKATDTMKKTLHAFLSRVANLFYNRSHIHPMIEISQSNEMSLAAPAHEMLKDISAKSPSVFKVHTQELCSFLEEHAPNTKSETSTSALDALKACATFARQHANELPNNKKFINILISYALRGTPPASAKHAVSVIMSVTDKKEMHAKDLVKRCVEEFKFGKDHFLSKLAALSQLMRYASAYLDEEEDIDPVTDIATNQVLTQTSNTSHNDGPDWQDQPDEDCESKIWALKILTNRIRSYGKAKSAAKETNQVLVCRLLDKILENKGELSTKTQSPGHHKSQLRLQAAYQYLKLCISAEADHIISPRSFNLFAMTVQDELFQVRSSLVYKIQKQLGRDRLSPRFYAPIFLLGCEPVDHFREDTLTWLRARAALYARSKRFVFEPLLARLISLCAHHPDFSATADDLPEFVRYLVYYLKATAREETLSLMYYVAQRVKTVQDGIDAAMSENLYCLADLSLAVIAQYEDIYNWSMQAYSGKIHLPTGIFAPMSNVAQAKETAEKQYLPEDIAATLPDLVRSLTRKSNKRKSEAEPSKPTKKRTLADRSIAGAGRKSASARKTKTPAKKPARKDAADSPEAPSSERRKSSRAATRKSYAEMADSEDDEEMGNWEEDDGREPVNGTPSSVKRKGRALPGGDDSSASQSEPGSDEEFED